MIETQEGEVAIVRASGTALAEVASAIDGLRSNGRVRGVVLVGAIVGASLAEVRAMRFAKDAEDAAKRVARRIASLGSGDKPVVAFVDGALDEPALGDAFEIALACTAIVATRRSSIALPESCVGLLPAGNGMLRVAERAGVRAVLDLLDGKRLSAEEALAVGLVDEIGDLDAARALARMLAERPRLRETLPRRRARRGRTLGSYAAEGNPIGRAVLLDRAKKEGRHPQAVTVLGR